MSFNEHLTEYAKSLTEEELYNEMMNEWKKIDKSIYDEYIYQLTHQQYGHNSKDKDYVKCTHRRGIYCRNPKNLIDRTDTAFALFYCQRKDCKY